MFDTPGIQNRLKKDGSRFPVVAYASPIIDGNKAVGLRRIAVDITELRQLEKRVVEYKELNELKSNLLSTVSHELRTPLADIQQYFEVILSGIVGGVTKKQKEMLGRVRERIDALLKLINDWLGMTRIKTGEVVKKFEPLDISSILKNTISFVRPQAEMRKITLEIDAPANLKKVKGDKESLKMMFTNLISNGIKFNREGGSVLIKAKEQDDHIVIEISDTGIGIIKEDLPFIFDEFFRVKSDKTRNIAGTGLGLSIVKKIAEAHSGSIKVKSELGKGSTFSVILQKFEKGSN